MPSPVPDTSNIKMTETEPVFFRLSFAVDPVNAASLFGNVHQALVLVVSRSTEIASDFSKATQVFKRCISHTSSNPTSQRQYRMAIHRRI